MKIEKFNSRNENLNEKLSDKWKHMDFRNNAKKYSMGDLESDWDYFKVLHSMLLDIMEKLDKKL